MKVFSYIETDYSLLADDREAYADFPMRKAYKTQEAAVAACIAEIGWYCEEYNEDLDENDPDRAKVPTPDEFEAQENGDLVYRESVDAPVYRVYAIDIE